MKKIMDGYYLREVLLSDAKDIFSFSSLDVVTKYLTWNSHKTIDDTIYAIKNIYFKKVLDDLPISYAIVDEKLNKVIGIIDFLKDKSDYPEVGYFLNPSYWNKGIMSNALKAIINIGFNELDFNVIGITHMDLNIGSRRVIEKNDFKFIEKINVFLPLKNVNVTCLYYELKRSDYNV